MLRGPREGKHADGLAGRNLVVTERALLIAGLVKVVCEFLRTVCELGPGGGLDRLANRLVHETSLALQEFRHDAFARQCVPEYIVLLTIRRLLSDELRIHASPQRLQQCSL